MTRSLCKDVARTPPHDTTSLSEILHARVGEILADHPDVRHDWNADRTHLVFPAENESGFDVEIAVGRDELIVAVRGAHEHFHVEEAGSAVDACKRALGLVRDLLSPHMRLREHLAGGKPYRWKLEVQTPEGWEMDSVTGLLWFNYFGRRAERVYQNHHLPGRMLAPE